MGQNWAVTIGINEYDNLRPLRFAQRDAEAMRDYCLREAGFDRVYYFAVDAPPIETDSGPRMKSKPVYATLKRFLRVRFEEPFLAAGDTLWFFFAGHGKRYQDRDYLLPSDVDPGDIAGTALAIRDVNARLRRSGAGKRFRCNLIQKKDWQKNTSTTLGLGLVCNWPPQINDP